LKVESVPGTLKENMWESHTRCAECYGSARATSAVCGSCGRLRPLHAKGTTAHASSALPENEEWEGPNPYSPPKAEVLSWQPLAPESSPALAPRATRLAATTIDALLAFGPVFLVSALEPVGDSWKAFLGLVLLCVLAVQIWGAAFVGQTLGKRVCRIRVDYQGGPPGFIRGIIFRTGLPALVGIVPVIGALFWLLDALFIFNRDGRCIHDWIAGTNVLKR
jgi:uncharacterized RDD family membrane protein YckC